MNIKKLLEYSKVDAERRDELKRFHDLDVVQNYRKKTIIIKKARATIEKINKDAEETLKQMKSVSDRYEELVSKIKDAEANSVNIEDENEADFYIKNINGYISQLERLSEEAKKVSEKIVSQKQTCEQMSTVGKEATKEAKAIQDEYKVESAKSKKILDEFDKRLQVIAKDIETADLERYKLVTSENKYPPIHVLENRYCYCRIEMPVSVVQKVSAEGWGICPDCGRILISENAYKAFGE